MPISYKHTPAPTASIAISALTLGSPFASTSSSPPSAKPAAITPSKTYEYLDGYSPSRPNSIDGMILPLPDVDEDFCSWAPIRSSEESRGRGSSKGSPAVGSEKVGMLPEGVKRMGSVSQGNGSGAGWSSWNWGSKLRSTLASAAIILPRPALSTTPSYSSTSSSGTSSTRTLQLLPSVSLTSPLPSVLSSSPPSAPKNLRQLSLANVRGSTPSRRIPIGRSSSNYAVNFSRPILTASAGCPPILMNPSFSTASLDSCSFTGSGHLVHSTNPITSSSTASSPTSTLSSSTSTSSILSDPFTSPASSTLTKNSLGASPASTFSSILTTPSAPTSTFSSPASGIDHHQPTMTSPSSSPITSSTLRRTPIDKDHSGYFHPDLLLLLASPSQSLEGSPVMSTRRGYTPHGRGEPDWILDAAPAIGGKGTQRAYKSTARHDLEKDWSLGHRNSSVIDGGSP